MDRRNSSNSASSGALFAGGSRLLGGGAVSARSEALPALPGSPVAPPPPPPAAHNLMHDRRVVRGSTVVKARSLQVQAEALALAQQVRRVGGGAFHAGTRGGMTSRARARPASPISLPAQATRCSLADEPADCQLARGQAGGWRRRRRLHDAGRHARRRAVARARRWPPHRCRADRGVSRGASSGSYLALARARARTRAHARSAICRLTPSIPAPLPRTHAGRGLPRTRGRVWRADG